MRQQLQRYVLRYLESTEASPCRREVASYVEGNWHILSDAELPIAPAIGQLGLVGTTAATEGTRVALAIASVGGEGRCLLRPSNPFVGYLGPVPMAMSSEVELVCDGGEAFLEQPGGRSVSGSPEVPLATIRSRAFEIVSLAGAYPVNDFLGDVTTTSNYPREAAISLQDGVDVLSATSPELADWAAAVICSVVAVTAQDAGTSSGSSERHPGMVSLSHPMCPEQVAAQIVHEASHQFLNLCDEWAPLTDRRSGNRYYSPFRRTTRPLRGVLLALHASVNMMRFLSDCQVKQGPSSYVSSELAELAPATERMFSDVERAPDLTDHGRLFTAELRGLVSATHG